MASLVIVGCQWGDEGKGKLVDYLTENCNYAVRFQGGNNAGHTLVVNGETTKLNLIPSGILHKNCVCLLAAGTVIDPEVILSEIDNLRRRGVEVSPQRLIVDRDAHLILAYHKLEDRAKEAARGESKIGTTGRGIGPAYEDRAERSGVRVAELANLPVLKNRIKACVEHTNSYVANVLHQQEQVSFDEVWAAVQIAAEKLLPHMDNVSLALDNACQHGEKVVFEGAQGTLLDQVHGTIPFVTSSNTIAGAVATGCGIGPKRIDWVFGVAKAYCTRVGSGPFPTELTDATGDLIRKVGHEFGTVTGRPRRCGWFDAFAMKRALRLNGVDSLGITKLDVLSGLDKIKVCINYRLDGRKLDDLPALIDDYDRVEPEFIELTGWREDITKVTKWHLLPEAARLYLATLSEILGCPINIVSVGPDRQQTIFSKGASFVKNFYA